MLDRVEHSIDLETSHDVINIYKCLTKKYKPDQDLLPCIVRCRKYFNEARYPASGSTVYSKEFCGEFLSYIDDVKSYVTDKCQANLDDLLKKFGS